MNAVQAKRNIRKAMEKPLLDAVMQAGLVMPDGSPAIQWPNMVLDRAELAKACLARETYPEYVRFGINFNTPLPRTSGVNPRIEMRGRADIDVFTWGGTGQDRNDTIAGIVAAAYPYDVGLVYEGVRVTIDLVEPKEATPDGAWFQGPVYVNWIVWRTT